MNLAERNKYRAHFRQLCCLGLADKFIVPDAIKTLHNIIEYDTTVFAWLNEHCQIEDAYLDFYAPEVVNFYIEEYHNLKSPYTLDLASLAKYHKKDVGNYRQMPRQYYKTDMYNLVCKPCEQYHLLDGVIKDNQRPLAAVLLCRRKNTRAFSSHEENQLDSLLGYFAHALARKPATESLEFHDTRMSGVIIATADGRISHISPQARDLMFWSNHRPLKPGTRAGRFEETLAVQVKALCRDLESIFRGNPQSPPVLTRACRHGRLSFRAHRMESFNGSMPRLIAITVTLQKPASLMVAEQIQQMPLSPKQKELCLMIGTGKTTDEVCSALHISSTTYKDHIQKIYRKLDINRREELLALFHRDPDSDGMQVSFNRPVMTPQGSATRIPGQGRAG